MDMPRRDELGGRSPRDFKRLLEADGANGYDETALHVENQSLRSLEARVGNLEDLRLSNSQAVASRVDSHAVFLGEQFVKI
jgi:hypothetical protein